MVPEPYETAFERPTVDPDTGTEAPLLPTLPPDDPELPLEPELPEDFEPLLLEPDLPLLLPPLFPPPPFPPPPLRGYRCWLRLVIPGTYMLRAVRA